MDAISELQGLIREHPYRERLSGLLMLALYRAGRQADALDAYRAARAVLVAELGIEPGDTLQRLEAAILVHDPALELPPTSTTPEPPRVAEPREIVVAVDSPTSLAAPRLQPRALDPPISVSRARRARSWLAGVVCTVIVATGVLGFVQQGPQPQSDQPGSSVDQVGFIGIEANRMSDPIVTSGPPGAVAVDGPVVWAVEPTMHALARIDAGSGAVVQTTLVGRDPSGVVVGGDSVWVSNHDDNTVSRISPVTNAVVQTIGVGAGPVALAAGYGSVWVTNSDDRTLTRIDDASGKVVATIRTNAVGRGIIVGHGSVWVTDEAVDRIVGVDPATNDVRSTIAVGHGPTGIAYGGGAVWVLNAIDGTVSRLDPVTLAVDATVSVPGGPTSISYGGDAAWVGTDSEPGVVKIRAQDGVVTGSTPLTGHLAGLAATSAGVWVSVQAAGAGHRGGSLVVIGSFDSIDPSVGELAPEPLDLAYDALTSLRYTGGSDGTEIVPDLALSLPQPTAGGTSYRFQLRSQIRYSDGRLVQATDFRRGLERLLRLNETVASTFSHVVGAQKCHVGRACDLTGGVEPDGTSAITFRLSSADPRFLEELSALVPIPAGIPLHDVGTAPVPGTGPYAIRSFVPGRLLAFERNQFFKVWSPTARPDGYPDEILFRGDGSDDDAVRQVVTGKADLLQTLGEPNAFAQLAAEHPQQVHTEAQQATVFMFLNTRRAPFDDLRVRRAVNFAVDRQRVSALYGSSMAQPTCQVIPPSTTGYRPYCPFTTDPNGDGHWLGPDLAKARSLVAASGTKGEQVVVWTFADFSKEANYLVGVLDELGYRARVHVIADPGTYFDTLDRRPDAQAGMYGWFGNPLAVDTLTTLTCTFTPNPARFCDRRIDAQVRQLARIEPSDPAKARDLAATIDREVTDQAPWVPLFTPQSIEVTSTRVGNYQAERGRTLVDQLWVK